MGRVDGHGDDDLRDPDEIWLGKYHDLRDVWFVRWEMRLLAGR